MWTSRTRPRGSIWKSADISGTAGASGPGFAPGASSRQPIRCAGTSLPGFASGRVSWAQHRTRQDAARTNRRMSAGCTRKAAVPQENERRVPSSGTRLHSRPSPPRLRGLFEVGQVAAEEIARALLHLPDALAREAPLLAQVLQRARIVLRQAVAQDVPRQLTHALARHRDDQAQVVDHQLLLRALVALAGATSDLELRLPVERGMGPDQLDQRRKVIEFAAVAHFCPFLPFPLCCLQRPSPPNDPDPWKTPELPIVSPTLPLMHNARFCC